VAFVESYLDSGLAVITMIQSENGNLLNKESLEELSGAFDSFIKNPDVRAVLLRSNGKTFCLGMDLESVGKAKEVKTIGKIAAGLYKNLLLKISKSSKPIMALINGDVKAGGVGLAAACDIIISSENSTFELSEVFLGLIPANVLPFILSRRISPQKTRYLILTSKKLTAQEAKEVHLVDEVFPEETLEKELNAITKTIFRAAPHALAEAKNFTQSIILKNVDEACAMAEDKFIELLSRPDVRKGIADFNEGGLPSWFSKFRPKKLLIKGGPRE
jgi:enoyl-CoA hydratase/carnithine racemase